MTMDKHLKMELAGWDREGGREMQEKREEIWGYMHMYS